MNMKEFNYCLRHHTSATIRMFNLKVKESPLVKREVDLVDSAGVAYGNAVVCLSCTCRVFSYAGLCPNADRCINAVTEDVWIAKVYFN